ncbi:MAG: peptidase, partial [Lawsonibacter sp.]|nr:peptidase [Lawsonibacter sp.]
MEYGQELLDFINLPDTVDFIARKSGYLLDAIQNDPQVFLTQTLMDRFVLGYVNRNHYDALFKLFGTGVLSTIPFILGPLNQEILDRSGITQTHKQPYLELKGGNVLFGIVDTGIDYTQPPFVYPDGTSKIQYIYDQTAIGTPPSDFTVGVEYTNEQINAALRAERPTDIVPETDTLGHGTFLTSVAAGRQVGDFIGAAPDAEIIAVKLRGARPYYRERFCVPPDQPYAFEATAVMVGVEYIVQKAFELGRPVSICIGLGTNFGGHNGTSILEEYLGIVSNLKGVCVS